MRLLHTKCLEFEEFFDSATPRYAILSHRWEEKETSFHEFEKAKQQEWPGFLKIRRCCGLAASRGFQWVWIDTCCIDKKSSAELSEAINSMYRWYAEAGECYAYLSDVKRSEDQDMEVPFAKSAWFTRGWTLQELLAPSVVIFFDFDWDPIGDKLGLLADISKATGIRGDFLNDIRRANIATKMSWISRRQTSREEDIAYCLLGIFDVNIPLLYGEGRKAFLRLELEILKKSDDESIFAWTSTEKYSGLLALWPDSFANSADIDIVGQRVFRQSYLMTNKGLEKITVRADVLPNLPLACFNKDDGRTVQIIIKLRHGLVIWQRVDCERLYKSTDLELEPKDPREFQTIYVPQHGL